ncbi:putative lipase ROG1 isoform X2 [Spinacia oleracea]|uniref:Lipase ROG1 isoform X2 n=1 Tax=Spinacia oleracea TaxID=3562 RepID=A0ABM3R0K2_SPIOL|nr:putative lipase ROG1 isoform X2 [Spinacia oleracea]
MATVEAENAMKVGEDSIVVRNKRKSMRKQRKSMFLPRFGCFRLGDESATFDKKNQDGSTDMVSDRGVVDHHPHPTHLIVMVNGIIGSAENWRYAAKQFLKAYPQDVLVHCSERNTSTLTFDGVDVMGERLADEVISVIERYPYLRKISFIGHSLGGLIARYAIALLYGENYLNRLLKMSGETGTNSCAEVLQGKDYIGKIAGLEPVNFITFATPHLGSRGHNQVPIFCGLHTLEIIARQTSWFLGKTGRHLFLTDKDKEKPPLLLRMANDCEDLPFLSALRSFNRRVAYANVRFDQLVGWYTSSLRHENELPKRRQVERNDKYRHILNVETGVVAAPQRGSTLASIMYGWKKLRTREMMKEMIKGLTSVSWERVDVKFGGGKYRFVAHNSIQVQTYWVHSAGADVIQHMIDNFMLSSIVELCQKYG